MNKNKIYQDLKDGLVKLVQRYPELIVKIEFNEVRSVFQVSYSPSSFIQSSEDFIKESMRFEDEMYDKYGDDTPLFTDDEELFKLSDRAEVVDATSLIDFQDISDTIMFETTMPETCDWKEVFNNSSVASPGYDFYNGLFSYSKSA